MKFFHRFFTSSDAPGCEKRGHCVIDRFLYCRKRRMSLVGTTIRIVILLREKIVYDLNIFFGNNAV